MKAVVRFMPVKNIHDAHAVIVRCLDRACGERGYDVGKVERLYSKEGPGSIDAQEIGKIWIRILKLNFELCAEAAVRSRSL